MNSGSIDLIATDPPFNKKRQFNAPLKSKASGQKFEDRWRWDEVTKEWHDLIATDYPAIKELIEAAVVIEGGSIDRSTGKVNTGKTKNSVAAFLVWMAPRLIEMKRVLKLNGSIYLHCDPTASHYLKLLMDAVFGKNNFRNEIVWRRTTGNKSSTKGLSKNSDIILRYSKSGKFTWNQDAVTVPYDLNNLDKKTLNQYSKTDSDGRRYTLDNLTDPTQNPESNCTYEVMGVTRTWRWTKERMDQEIANGRVVQTKRGNVPRFKRYLDEQEGKKKDSIWTDIPRVEGKSKESTGWKTQKPIALYQRIIQASSNKEDLVLDPFAGCATTCVAAESLQRRWIGIDIDKMATTVTRDQLFKYAGLTQELDDTFVQVKTRPPKRTDSPSMSNARMRLVLWKKQGHRCANPYCSSESDLRKEDLHLDHVIPKSRGGSDDISNRNALCGNCNSRKGKKAWGMFLDEERSKQPHPSLSR